MDPAYYRSYIEYYGTKNIYLMQGAPLFRPGRVCREAKICSDEEATKTEFWNDWIRPQKMQDAIFASVLREKSHAAMLNRVRHRRVGPFAEEDVQLVRILMPHLKRALQLHLRIAELEGQRRASTEALSRWSRGVILVDHNGYMLLMNRSAEVILSQKDGLNIDAEGLHASHPRETAALRKLIHGAIQASSGHGLSFQPGDALALSRPSLKRPLNVLVTPVCPHDGLIAAKGTAAIVFVSDPETREETDVDVLLRFHGFSKAEAKVASLLVHGNNVREVSDKLHVTLNDGIILFVPYSNGIGSLQEDSLCELQLASSLQNLNEKLSET